MDKQELVMEIKNKGLYCCSVDVIERAIDVFSQLEGLTVNDVNTVAGIIKQLAGESVIASL